MTDPTDESDIRNAALETKLTKAQLRKVYRDWAAEEIEAIELIEAVSKFLGEWGKPVPATKPFTFADPARQAEHERHRAESRKGREE